MLINCLINKFNNYSSYTVSLYSGELKEIYSLLNLVSGKYLLICIIITIYLSYYSINDKIIYSSYTSDNYNDYLLSKFTLGLFAISKFSIHYINNKILHPITLFLQNF